MSFSLSSTSTFFVKGTNNYKIRNSSITRNKINVNNVIGKKYKGSVMREEKLTEIIEKKEGETTEACEGEGGGGEGLDGCKVAWDEEEEESEAKAHLKRRLAESGVDPLHSFCEGDDECVIFYGDD